MKRKWLVIAEEFKISLENIQIKEDQVEKQQKQISQLLEKLESHVHQSEEAYTETERVLQECTLILKEVNEFKSDAQTSKQCINQCSLESEKVAKDLNTMKNESQDILNDVKEVQILVTNHSAAVVMCKKQASSCL